MLSRMDWLWLLTSLHPKFLPPAWAQGCSGRKDWDSRYQQPREVRQTRRDWTDCEVHWSDMLERWRDAAVLQEMLHKPDSPTQPRQHALQKRRFLEPQRDQVLPSHLDLSINFRWYVLKVYGFCYSLLPSCEKLCWIHHKAQQMREQSQSLWAQNCPSWGYRRL